MTRQQIGAHIPWQYIDDYLDQVLDLGLIPEIAIKGPQLDSLDQQCLQKVSKVLSDKGLRPRVHAPFFDLNPGALDPLIRDATRKRLQQTLKFAGKLNASLIVIHPGVDKWRYPNLEDMWMENAFEFFTNILKDAVTNSCQLAIENIYEENPQTLVRLVDRLDSHWFGHCFDIGHWNLFGKLSMSEWLEAIGSKLIHLHLHDNHGQADEHLPIGNGDIDFNPLLDNISQNNSPPGITLEAHSIEDLQLSLKNAQTMLFS